MPKYFISVTVYATYEYANEAEIEADSAEGAGRKFEELVAQRGNGIIRLSNPISKVFDIGGNYSVYAMPDDEDAADVDDMQLEIESESFSGTQ